MTRSRPPRYVHRAFRLPRERELTIGFERHGTAYMNKHRGKPTVRKIDRKNGGFDARWVSLRFTAHVTVTDFPRRMRLNHEEHVRVEDAINNALTITGQRVTFDRDENGHIHGWGSVPVQAEGVYLHTDQVPRRFYFRFRHNWAEFRVFTPGPTPEGGDLDRDVWATASDAFYPETPENEYAGSFDPLDDMAVCVAGLVASLKPYDVDTNPTANDQISRAVVLFQLGAVPPLPDGSRDLAKERALLDERAGDPAIRVVRQAWEEDPVVKVWLATQPAPPQGTA